jgi:hypothetical protein
MSLSAFVSALLPDRKVELVRKITQKTREGKILCQRTNNGAAALVPGALRMNFVDAPWAGLLFTTRWVIFAVRDELGNELLKVENQSGALPSSEPPVPSNPLLLPPPPQPATSLSSILGDPLLNAVTELHNLVRAQEGKGAVDRAIDLLDKI